MNYELISIVTQSGKKLQAFAGDHITQSIVRDGEYDKNTLQSISDILRILVPRTSLDVGANIGNHTLIINEYSKRTVAFEPVPFIFDVLQENICQNNEADKIVRVNAGLSNIQGRVEILVPDNGNLGASAIESCIDITGSKHNIQLLIGDDYLESIGIDDVDFIKIDVEGHEAEALQGLSHTIQSQQPLLLLEYRSDRTLEMFEKMRLFDTLFYNYRIYSLSKTSSKKSHKRSILGFSKRIFYKIFDDRWCLSSFDSTRHYSNIYLVPNRYIQYFAKLKLITS